MITKLHKHTWLTQWRLARIMVGIQCLLSLAQQPFLLVDVLVLCSSTDEGTETRHIERCLQDHEVHSRRTP